MDIDKLNMAIMNIPCKKTLSHFATVSEAQAYKLGHRDARHAAVEILLEHFKDDAEPSVAADERALFETWASGGSHVTLSHVFSFTPHPNQSRYLDGTTELCWRAWRACHALASPAVNELRDFVKKIADLPDTELEGPLAPELKYLRKDARKILAPVTQQAVSQMDGAAEKVSCPACNGTGGVMMEGDCSDCNGKGYDWEPVEPAATTTSTDRFLDNWEDGESWGGAHAATTASASDFNICYEAGVRCQCKDGEEICLRNRRAQAPSREAAPDMRAAYEVWAADNLPQYSSGREPTWGTVEANVRAETWNAWRAALAQQGASHAANAGEDTERDAARYRWLRNPSIDVGLVLDKRTGWVPPDESCPGVGGYHTYEYRAGEELDAAIDAAIASSAAQEGK
jgi:hypothetical protein